MATTTDLTTVTEDEARMRAFQIIGSDIDHTWTGNWHDTLRTAAATWATPTNPPAAKEATR